MADVASGSDVKACFVMGAIEVVLERVCDYR
jgi:hypothetical protein